MVMILEVAFFKQVVSYVPPQKNGWTYTTTLKVCMVFLKVALAIVVFEDE